MANRGRKSLLTAKRREDILEVIRSGGTEGDAIETALISPDTYYNWKRTKPDFFKDVTQARIQGKMARLRRINRAAENDWRADAWYLERRFPEEYAQQLIIKVTPEQSTLLKKYGMTPQDAWLEMLNEFAQAENAETSNQTD